MQDITLTSVYLPSALTCGRYKIKCHVLISAWPALTLKHALYVSKPLDLPLKDSVNLVLQDVSFVNNQLLYVRSAMMVSTLKGLRALDVKNIERLDLMVTMTPATIARMVVLCSPILLLERRTTVPTGTGETRTGGYETFATWPVHVAAQEQIWIALMAVLMDTYNNRN